MNHWKYPKFNQPSNLLEVTDEMLSQWEKENNECEEFNKSVLKTFIEMRENILASAKNIWGEDSNVVKYLQKQRINKPSLYTLNNIKSGIVKAKEAEKKRLHDIERRQKHLELCGKAIKFLTERNRVINIDFNVDNAISIANDIAFIEATYNKKKELIETQTSIEFIGWNCGDSEVEKPCRGWD